MRDDLYTFKLLETLDIRKRYVVRDIESGRKLRSRIHEACLAGSINVAKYIFDSTSCEQKLALDISYSYRLSKKIVQLIVHNRHKIKAFPICILASAVKYNLSKCVNDIIYGHNERIMKLAQWEFDDAFFSALIHNRVKIIKRHFHNYKFDETDWVCGFLPSLIEKAHKNNNRRLLKRIFRLEFGKPYIKSGFFERLCKNGDHKMIKMIIRYMPDIDIIGGKACNDCNHYSLNPFIKAIRAGHTKVVKALLKLPRYKNIKDIVSLAKK
jgi:hypothetical protein